MCEKNLQKLKCYTFKSSSLSEYNQVKVVLVLKRIEFNKNYESKNNKTDSRAYIEKYIYLEICLNGVKNYQNQNFKSSKKKL